ncbi:MAG: YncE family protein [Actinomycetota bacterium]
MRVRLLVTGSVLALLGAACVGSADQSPPAPESAVTTETLLLGTVEGPLVVRVPDGSVLFEQQDAVASLGGSWLLSTSTAAGSTVLREIDGATGDLVSSARVDGDLEVRVVSESGRAAALMDPLPAGWDPAVPLPRARTTIVVADPAGGSEPTTFDLPGNFEPEAFSTDDSKLFLIQHLPAETPSVYRVTLLDLRSGKVRPVFGPFKGAPERMPGTRLQQELSPTAEQLYTLYSSSRPGYAPHEAPVANGTTVSFVHVLSLEEGWAHCVGLPESMWDRPSAEQAMATTPDGSRLFVIDAGRGLAAILHTETLEVRTAPVSLPTVGGIRRTTARMSPDGDTLFVAVAGRDGGSFVTALDARTLEVLDTWRVAGSVSGLGVSSDGTSVYAAVEGVVVVLDAATGREVRAVPVPTDAPVVRVTPLAG